MISIDGHPMQNKEISPKNHRKQLILIYILLERRFRVLRRSSIEPGKRFIHPQFQIEFKIYFSRNSVKSSDGGFLFAIGQSVLIFKLPVKTIQL